MAAERPEVPRIWRPAAVLSHHDFKVFSVRRQRFRERETAHEAVFSIIDCPDWANVVAVTPAGEAVLVRQYRPGVDRVTLEIPGGVVETAEAPRDTAERELREETGFVAREIVELGVVESNPALQTNRTHTFLAHDARPLAAPAPDELESLGVELVPVSALPLLVSRGEITHSLVIAALYFYALHAGDAGAPGRER